MNHYQPSASRRSFIQAAAGLPAMPIRGAARSSRRPNILFLMADQFRGDCLGADGNRAIHTPNLDRIAREGARFRCAYSSTPTCTPARSALLTGLSPWNHGMLLMQRMATHYPFVKPQAMRDAGYYTTSIGKNHFHPQRTSHGYHRVVLDESSRAETPEFRSDYRAWFYSQAPNLDPDATGIGFNDYASKPYALPEHLHPTSWTGQTAVRFLETYNRAEPFFLKVSFARPHSPYDPPERLFNRYAGASLPAASIGKWAARYIPRSWEKSDIWHGDMGPEQVRRSRQGYYGSVNFVDEYIGRILEALEKRGWLEETLILFTADHGDMTGDHHLWRKSYAYEPSARIPMLLRWPSGLVSAPRGQTLTQPVELRDVLPTFLDAASAAPSKPLDGSSLLALARGDIAGWRPWIDLEHGVCYNDGNDWNALTDGHWKYIFHARHGEEQLFHLDRDPHEVEDLSADPASTSQLRLWRGRLIDHLSVRGEQFVRGGALVTRPKSIPRSPNFPA